VLTTLLAHADAVGEIDWTVSADSTINRAHQHATTLARHCGVCGITRICARSRLITRLVAPAAG
jgi:hypothetical protein